MEFSTFVEKRESKTGKLTASQTHTKAQGKLEQELMSPAKVAEKYAGARLQSRSRLKV